MVAMNYWACIFLLAHFQYGVAPIDSRDSNAAMHDVQPAHFSSPHFGFSSSGIWSMACAMLSYRLSVSVCTAAGWILESVRSILMGCRWERGMKILWVGGGMGYGSVAPPVHACQHTTNGKGKGGHGTVTPSGHAFQHITGHCRSCPSVDVKPRRCSMGSFVRGAVRRQQPVRVYRATCTSPPDPTLLSGNVGTQAAVAKARALTPPLRTPSTRGGPRSTTRTPSTVGPPCGSGRSPCPA